MSEIGSTGLIVSANQQSATFDLRTNTLYWAALTGDDYDPQSAIYTVDLTTGKATKVADFDETTEILALYIPYVNVPEGAPDAVTNLNVDFSNGSLTGTVSFKAPEKAYNGDPITEELTWSIIANDKVAATGNTTAGDQVSSNVTLPVGGETKLVVKISNSKGNGPEVAKSFYAGFDKPVAVDKVNFTLDDTHKATVRWNNVSEGIHGGYIGNVTYNVVRQPGNVIVANGIGTNSFSETIAEGNYTAYNYEVTVVNGDSISDVTKSNYLSSKKAYGIHEF